MFFVRLVEPVQLYHTTVPGTTTANPRAHVVHAHIYACMCSDNIAHAHAAGARFDIRRVASGADLVADAPHADLVSRIESLYKKKIMEKKSKMIKCQIIIFDMNILSNILFQ